MTVSNSDFPRCAVCGQSTWQVVYEGPIRAGRYPASQRSVVMECQSCGIQRIPESVSLSTENYESDLYRSLLGQTHDTKSYFDGHDALMKYALNTLDSISYRGKTVADIGCGGGALLDHVAGISATKIAVEPDVGWSESLKERGYVWYPTTASALEYYSGAVDVIYSVQVIEHVAEPREFLLQIYQLLKSGGVAVVTTPNRNDILMELAPKDFPKFFYRVQHKWAFDSGSLLKCAELAGISKCEVIYDHRYNLANAIRWIRDGEPGGRQSIGCLDAQIDKAWTAWLASVGKSDNLTLVIKK